MEERVGVVLAEGVDEGGYGGDLRAEKGELGGQYIPELISGFVAARNGCLGALQCF